MSYRADKPYGRRKTDRPLSDEKRRHLQSIRRDVDEDPTGTIRRYLRLASKALDNGQIAHDDRADQSWLRLEKPEAA
jgi:hypothetical protein